MTEKPFKLDDFDSEVEMWELLNTQREIIIDLEKENEHLKSNLKELHEICVYYETRIKELKNEIKDYEDTLATQEQLIQKLRKQNTRTYLTIKEAINNERTEIGKNVLKQLLNSLE